jgi:hypothetical protein
MENIIQTIPIIIAAHMRPPKTAKIGTLKTMAATTSRTAMPHPSR